MFPHPKKQLTPVIYDVNLVICDYDNLQKFQVPKTILTKEKTDVSYFFSLLTLMCDSVDDAGPIPLIITRVSSILQSDWLRSGQYFTVLPLPNVALLI